MEIRLDKCCSFGFLKTGGNLTQILPKIYIKTGDIPAIPQGGYFKYLGRYFDFKMNDSKGKAELLEKVEKYLKTISDLRIRPQTKIKILDRYISSQISFTLRNYNFSSTWISEHLDALCIRFVRLWLESPISSCVAEWLVVPNTKCGLGVPSFKNRAERLCLSKRAALKNSNNQNIQLLWKDSTLKHVNADSLLLNNSLTAAQPILVKTQQVAAVQHFLSLEYQGKSARLITSLLSPKAIKSWHTTVNKLPGYLYNFTWKAFQSQLPTLANLQRWGKSISNVCPLCNCVQTNKHVLSNCGHKISLSRYTIRHNNILNQLATWINSKIPSTSKLYVDLPTANFLQSADLFNNLRPDLAVVDTNKVHVLELTVCHETNLESSKAYKTNKYKNLNQHKADVIKNHSLIINTCELSVLGFVSVDDSFFTELKIEKFDSAFVSELTKSVIELSYNIYIHRNTLS
jgi:hypothetical protein